VSLFWQDLNTKNEHKGVEDLQMPIERSKLHPTVKIWHPELVNIYDSEIGEGTKIACFVEIGGSTIGDFCKIECGVFIPPGSVIEDKVFVGPNVSLTNDRYPTLLTDKWEKKPVKIEYGARIGSNSVIVSGVTIGREALIGSGSVVTEDIPPRSIAYGNPARIKGYDRIRDKIEKLLAKHPAIAISEFGTEITKIFEDPGTE
jgi:UDP-2-acetamido-3-amino-2,3-dideoxy-glucuronate N-acetyltransferase